MNILIIKLGADGDVLRTLPLAKALKEQHPKTHITWVTRGDIASLLEHLPYISEVVTLPWQPKKKFDALYNFDIDKEATELAQQVDADKKYGFYAEGGYPAAFNLGAEYYLNTLFDDELKKSNRKTYQEMMFAAADLPYNQQNYEIVLDEADLVYAHTFTKQHKLKTEKLIGIHLGASSRWPSKAWAESRVKEFIKKAKAKGFEILLFGGPNETERQKVFVAALRKEGIEVLQNNPANTKREFAALVSLCSVMVCSDSLALHVALGLNKKTIGLFFCTSPHEVEGYGLLRKIVSPFFEAFFPERMNVYDATLVESITAEEVLEAVERA